MRGARVWSDGAPRPDVDALAIQGGGIVALAREADLSSLAGPRTLVLDAAGATVTPGLVDAHVHLVQWAQALTELDLSGAVSREDLLERVSRRMASQPGEAAVVGRGWDANCWTSGPERAALDAISGRRPVLLHSHDCHALWVNGAALERCGITRATADPDGGRIVRDGTGEPTGLLQENAVRLCAALLTSAGGGAADAEAVGLAVSRLHAKGITGVHDFEGAAAMRTLREVCTRGGVRLRVLMHLAHSGLDDAIALGLESGLGDDGFRLGAIKLFADGTLGSRTAAMLAPYEADAGQGMDLIPAAELRAIVGRATHAGLSVAIHAIGDRAVRASLDAFEAAGPELARLALPPRIEHLQLVDPSDLPRFRRLGVAASMQPSHAISDAATADRQWGGRVAHAYPWRELLDAGALLAFGSDAPVEPPDPSEGLRAAVTRGVPGRATAFTPHQCVALDEALTAYTEAPARLAGTWPRAGSLRVGSAADLVVWNANLHELAAPMLGTVTPALTMLAGAVVYRAAGVARGAATAGATR